MNRRLVLADILCAAFAPALVPTTVLAQPAQLPRVIWIIRRQVDGNLKPMQTEKDVEAALAAHGLVIGRDLAVIFAELPSARDAFSDARATGEIEAFFGNLAYDPSKLGFVESLRRPGGNMTGTDVGWDDIHAKQWQLLKELVPSMKRGAFLTETVPDAIEQTEWYRSSKRVWRETMQQVTTRLRIEPVTIALSRDPTEEQVLNALMEARADAVMMDREMTPQIHAALVRLKLPSCGGLVRNVRRGLLMGVTFSFAEGERYAAAIVARILKGEPPSTIPVYRTTKYYLYLNRATARAIGIKFPDSILLQADEVID